MEHADARERLVGAAADPSALDRLAALLGSPATTADTADGRAVTAGADASAGVPDPSAPAADAPEAADARADSDLRAHLETCAACRADLEGWRATAAAIRGALASPDPRPDAVPADPAALRAVTLARVRESGVRTDLPARPLVTGIRSGWASRLRRGAFSNPLRLAGVAAAVVALVLGTAVIRDLSAERDRAQQTARAAASLAATVDQVLQEPGARVVTLHGPASSSASGVLLWGPSSGQVVVMTQALAPPPAGSSYDCWFEQAGRRVVVGRMTFSGDLAYWAGPLDAWTSGDPSGLPFGVSLATAGGSPGAPMLVGRL